jgi:hypothetical protein
MDTWASYLLQVSAVDPMKRGGDPESAVNVDIGAHLHFGLPP